MLSVHRINGNIALLINSSFLLTIYCALKNLLDKNDFLLECTFQSKHFTVFYGEPYTLPSLNVKVKNIV